MGLGKRNPTLNYHQTGIMRGLKKKNQLSDRKDFDIRDPSGKFS